MTWHHTRTVADGPGRSPVVKRGRPVAIDQGAVSEQGGLEVGASLRGAELG